MWPVTVLRASLGSNFGKHCIEVQLPEMHPFGRKEEAVTVLAV